MINYWLIRATKRRITKNINNLLAAFIGTPVVHLDIKLPEMRQTVLSYFNQHPDDLKVFVGNSNRLEYKLNIQEKNGYVTLVSFEEKQ